MPTLTSQSLFFLEITVLGKFNCATATKRYVNAVLMVLNLAAISTSVKKFGGATLFNYLGASEVHWPSTLIPRLRYFRKLMGLRLDISGHLRVCGK